MPSQLNNTKQGAPEGRPPRINLLAWIVTSVVLGFVLLLALRLAAQQHVTINGTCTQAGVSVPCTVAGFEQQDTVTVAIAPQNPTVASAGTQQFTAMVQFSQNVSVLWSATAGAVDATGLFTAPSVSVDTPVAVTATSVADTTKFATTVATVKAAAAITVAVSPKTVTLKTGATQQFTASVMGNPNTSVTWAAVGGTIDATGLFTAGATAGTATITATSAADTTRSDSATATITAPLPTSGIISNKRCGTPAGGMDAVANLPKMWICSSEADTPAPGPVVSVSASGSVQTAYNNAVCGTKIDLTPGATYSYSTLTLAAKNCPDTAWIWIETAPTAGLPAEGVRTSPCNANKATLPGYKYTCVNPQQLMAKIVISTQLLFQAADHIRLKNVEVAESITSPLYNLLNINGANKIVVDRSWLHGNAGEELSRTVWMQNSKEVSVIENYISDAHCLAGGLFGCDGQAVAADFAYGPFKISDNMLSAGGEPVLFGGSGGAGPTPQNIQIDYNDVYKPWSWMPSCTSAAVCPDGTSVYDNGGGSGKPYTVKNCIEFKNGALALIEFNVLQNNWAGFSQVGNCITLTPKSQAPNGCSGCYVQDITERYNTMLWVAQPWQLFVGSTPAGWAAGGNRWSLHDDVASHVHYANCYGGCTNYYIELIGGSAGAPPASLMHDVSMVHETVVLDLQGGSAMFALGGILATPPPLFNLFIKDSILPAGQYGIMTSGGGTSNCAYLGVGVTKLDACWLPYTFTHNGIPWGLTSMNLGATQILTGNQSTVGYSNLAAGDFTLTPASPFKGKATDGKDLGADAAFVKQQAQFALVN